MSLPPRILVVDDHALAREGLRAILLAAGYDVVGEAASGEQAIAIAPDLAPDLVLLDIRLGQGMDGLETAAQLRTLNPGIRVLMVTLHDMPEYVRASLAAGAAGYVLKDASLSEIKAAVEQVLAGQTAIPSGLLARALQRPASHISEKVLLARLTARERDVLELVTLGHTNKSIGRELSISPATVKVHVERIIAKLGVSDRTEAAVLAVRASHSAE
jgi:DNA-binding NarL/FixJ family response regulator